jgi:hypothetical protein
MKQLPTEKNLFLTGLIITGLALSVAALFTDIPAGGADNFAHFNISRWAFRYPHLFLDHWGKPVFTFLTAPFAQLGMMGVRIFNIIAGLLTAWFAYKLAVHFKLRYAWLSGVITVLTPIYFMMMTSGMTEVLFSLFLVMAVYLFFREKYILSALLVSFIFLVRNEGLLSILLFLTGFVLKKQYRAIPFLLTGFLVSSLAGSFVHNHDFWWLITQRPYSKGGVSVYGAGNWYHFFIKLPGYFGYIVTFLLYAGTISMLLNWKKEKWNIRLDSFLLIILVLGSFWGYFAGHTYMWWKGDSSAGLVRVMAAVSPLVSIMSLFFVNSLKPDWLNSKVMKICALVVSLILAGTSIRHYHRSVSRDLNAEILKRVSLWLKRPENLRHKLVIHNPYFSWSTGIDAWDPNVVQYGFSNNDTPGTGVPDSTLFVWDAHFSANEGQMPLGKIMNNPDFELVNWFEPLIPFKVLGGNNYKIFIFRKISGRCANNYAILENLKAEVIEKGVYYTELIDFEQPWPSEEMELQRRESPFGESGHAYFLEGLEFSPSFHITDHVLKNDVESRIRVSCDMLVEEIIPEGRLLCVFSIEKEHKVLHYAVSDLASLNIPVGNHYNVDIVFNVPALKAKGATMKSYLWNIDRRNVIIDNYGIEIYQTTNLAK